MSKKQEAKKPLDTLVTHDMFLKHTDKDGASHVQCHRVWDGERFFAARFDECKRIGGKASVEMVSEAFYRSAR